MVLANIALSVEKLHSAYVTKKYGVAVFTNTYKQLKRERYNCHVSHQCHQVIQLREAETYGGGG